MSQNQHPNLQDFNKRGFLKKFFMIETEESNYEKLFIAILIVFSVLIPFAIKMSMIKKKQVMNPKNNVSYCIITIWILNVLIFVFAIQLSLNFLLFILIWSNPTIGANSYAFLWMIYTIPQAFCYVIVFLQAYEWFTMLFITVKQKGKTMGEIMFEIHNSPNYKKF